MSAAAVASTALSIVQLVSAGKELVSLFQEGTITEEQMVKRWQANATELAALEKRWLARQEAKKQKARS